MNKYILTVNDYIENYQVGNTITLTDNQKLYLKNSITGSSTINSKYDSTTDSFIEPIGVNNIEASTDLYYDGDNEKDIEYFTGSLPVTISFNNNITTATPPTESLTVSNLGQNSLILTATTPTGSFSVNELEISDNKLQFKLEPNFTSGSIDWNEVSASYLSFNEMVKIKVNSKSLQFNSLNDKLSTNSNPYEFRLTYSSSFSDPSI